MVVERLHVDRPEPTPPEPTLDVKPSEKPEHPVAIPVNGEWQTFPNPVSYTHLDVYKRQSKINTVIIYLPVPKVFEERN